MKKIFFLYLFIGLFTFKVFASSCPEKFLSAQPKAKQSQFSFCQEDEKGVYVLRQLETYRIDLEYYEKNNTAFNPSPGATLKFVGSKILPINGAAKPLYQDINKDDKPEFVFRVSFERGASLIGARFENNQFQFVQFFPTQETSWATNHFLIHSDRYPINIENGLIKVVVENIYMDQVTSQDAEYSLRQNNIFYLSRLTPRK
ncbi:hypothetical protein K2X05_07720 [bacterium]|nr:hypothetical protein [bacterium]